MASTEICTNIAGIKSPTQNLTGPPRKLRDHCVHYLNCLTMLRSLNVKGQLFLNEVLAVYKKHGRFPDLSQFYSDFHKVQDLIGNLKGILNDIELQVDTLSKITNVLHEQLKMEKKLKIAEFFELGTEEICSIFQESTQNEKKNYEAKKSTVQYLYRQTNSNDLFYIIACWVLEPYNGGGYVVSGLRDVKGMVVEYKR